MLEIDLKNKRAFVAGVADDGGFGFAIAKHLAQAGATVCVGTWPPAYTIFTKILARGKLDASLQFRPAVKPEAALQINEALAQTVIGQAEKLAAKMADPEEISPWMCCAGPE